MYLSIYDVTALSLNCNSGPQFTNAYSSRYSNYFHLAKVPSLPIARFCSNLTISRKKKTPPAFPIKHRSFRDGFVFDLILRDIFIEP